VAAVTPTLALRLAMSAMLYLHNRLCLVLLSLSGIPVTAVVSVDLFAWFGSASVPVVAVDRMGPAGLELWILFVAGMLVLLEFHRRIPIARGFLVFLMILLAVAAGVIVFHPSDQIGSAEFAQNWLRGEMLVWLVLPWFSAGMFVLPQPAAMLGIGWALLAQIYGFAWSAVRLAFCIAVMHYSGMLFSPMLWFALGFLADLVYFVVFYSIAVQWSAKRSWGSRT
jgi:hypothetical protein